MTPNPLQNLITKLCPNGVEFHKLGDVCKSLPKGTLKTTQLKNDGYPVINSGRELYGYYSDFNNEGNAFTIASRGEYAGFTTFLESRFWAGGLCYPYRSKNENQAVSKFIFYYLKIREREIMDTLVSRASIPAINKADCDKIKIPLPPLEIQNRIVEILDTFTELEKELEKELSARKKQYEFYRNAILSFESLWARTERLAKGAKVEIMSLGEIGIFTRGNGLAKADFVESGVPCIHYGQIYTQYQNVVEKTLSFVSHQKAQKFKKARRGDLIIARTSENKEDICKAVVYLGDSEVCISGHSFAFSHSQNPKFIGYLFQTNAFHDFKKKNIFGTKVYDMHEDRLANFQIPLPPIEVQNEVVEILDRCDAMVNSITEGLPAEIQARKKQYEYYRDRLLSFEA